MHKKFVDDKYVWIRLKKDCDEPQHTLEDLKELEKVVDLPATLQELKSALQGFDD